MQINLPYQAKLNLLDVLRDYIPVELRKFTGEVVVSLKEGDVGVVKYTGFLKIRYVDNDK